MGNTGVTPRHASDDSDAYVTVDMRSVILDLPDDGRVSELLPARGARDGGAPSSRRPSPPVRPV